MKTCRAFYLVIVINLAFVFYALPAYAAPSPQASDAVQQCAKGVDLFLQGNNKDALPLLEAGFNGRDNATFAVPEELGYCALVLGYLRISTANLNGAMEALQVALPIFQASQERELEGNTLNNIGLVYASQGRYDQALDYYLQALVIRREISDRKGEGTTLDNIGMVYSSQGQYVQALDYYQQALAIRREVKDQKGEGTTLNNIGVVYSNQGQYTQALDYYQRALAIHSEVVDRAGEGTTLSNLGLAYASQGQYALALEYYQQALAIRREVGDRVGEGKTLSNFGLVYVSKGQFATALNYYQQALSIHREVGDRAGEGSTLNNIGLVYRTQGRYTQALDYYQQALFIMREIGDQAVEAIVLNNLGAVYKAQGEYVQALEYYQQALDNMQAVGNRTGEGTTLNNLGTVYFDQAQYAQALDYYQKALIIKREVGNRAEEGAVLNNIGMIYRAQGQYAKGMEYFQQALTIAQEIGNWTGEGGTLNNIGEIYRAQAQYEQALDYYKQSIAVVEEIRALAGNDTARASFIAQYVTVYQSATFSAYQLQQDDQAFAFSEQGRARSFLDALTTGMVELSDQSAGDLIAREQETYAGWLAAQDSLATAKALTPSDSTLISDLENHLLDTKQAHTEALQAIEARGDELIALVPARSTVLSLSDIQALLDNQTTLVSYFIIDDQSGALAFIITSDSFSVVELPAATPTKIKIAVEGLLPSLQDAHSQPMQDLYTWLIAPIKDQIRTPQVGIIPHLTLHYIPFASLSDGQTYFGEQYQLFELPSASSLRYIKQHAAQATNSGAAVFGNPATNEPGLPILPYAAAEAASVASTLDVSDFTGTNATELQVRESVSGKAVLHLAVHGSYNQYNPLYSKLYLAPDSNGQYDGRLEVHEIFGLDLKGSQLVVLSACETQLGQLSTGDEVVGMTRAFMFAGAPSVLASLWQVDDEATQVLMTSFYKHWREEGMNKAQALQAAQADVRANPNWQSPYYWAAFVLNGDVGTTPIQPMNEITTETAPTSNPSSPICPNTVLAPVALIGLTFTTKRRPCSS